MKDTLLFLVLFLTIVLSISVSATVITFESTSLNLSDSSIMGGGYAGNNMGANPAMYIKGTGAYYGVFNWSYTQDYIPVGATINWVKMQMYANEAVTGIAVDCWAMTTQWTEGTGADLATPGNVSWNYPRNGYTWTTAGGDFDITQRVFNETVQMTATGFYNWTGNITYWQDYYDGDFDGVHFGFLCKAAPVYSDETTYFDTSDSATSLQRPVLYVNYTVSDVVPPSYSNFQNNASTTTKINGIVNWSADLSDETGLSTYKFTHNQSGTLINVSNGTLSGLSVFVNYTLVITKTRGNYICGQYWFNDTLNNVNQTNLSCFSVANSIPTTPTIYFPQEGFTYNNIPYINFSSVDSDGDTITYNIYINDTLNISTTTNVTQWNASDGYYRLDVKANDSINEADEYDTVYFTLDSTAPEIANMTVTGSNLSGTQFYVNITTRDLLSNVSNWTISTNQTGVWQNATWSNVFTEVGGWFIIIYEATITAAKNTVFGVIGYVKDVAGNIAQTTMELITVGNGPPPSTTFIIPDTTLYSSSVNFTMNWTNVTDPDGDTVYYRLWFGTSSPPDTIYYNNIGTNWTVNLSDGQYYFSIDTFDGTDFGDNTTIHQVNINTTDITSPVITIQNPTPGNGSVHTGNSVIINISYVETSFSSCILDWDGINETMYHDAPYCNVTKTTVDGVSYSFRVYVLDVEGNMNVTGNYTFTENSLPSVANLNFSPYPVYTNSSITITYIFSDAENATNNQSTYKWFNTTNLIVGETSNILTTSKFTKGYNVTCQVIPNDGYENGLSVNFTTLVSGSLPVITYLNLSPDPAYLNASIISNVTAIDYDGDTITIYYEWYRNGTKIDIPYDTANLTTDYFNKTNNITLRVTPNTNEGNGSYAEYSVLIVNSPPIIIYTSPSTGTFSTWLDLRCTAIDFDTDVLTYDFSIYYDNGSGMGDWYDITTNTTSAFTTFYLSNLSFQSNVSWICNVTDGETITTTVQGPLSFATESLYSYLGSAYPSYLYVDEPFPVTITCGIPSEYNYSIEYSWIDCNNDGYWDHATDYTNSSSSVLFVSDTTECLRMNPGSANIRGGCIIKSYFNAWVDPYCSGILAASEFCNLVTRYEVIINEKPGSYIFG